LEQHCVRGRYDIMFFNAGVDPHGDDRLGLLNLTDKGLQLREHRVMRAAQRIDLPICGVLGGGYAPEIDALVRRHSYLHHAAVDVFQPN